MSNAVKLFTIDGLSTTKAVINLAIAEAVVSAAASYVVVARKETRFVASRVEVYVLKHEYASFNADVASTIHMCTGSEALRRCLIAAYAIDALD